MKKAVAFSVLLTMILSGCADASGDLPTRVRNAVEIVLDHTPSKANKNKTYYSYYIEPSVGRYSSDETGNVFTYDGARILMNLNIPVIINSETYPDSTDDGTDTIASPLVELKGTYQDSENVQENYRLCIYQDGNEYLTMLSTDTVNLFSLSDKNKTVSIAAEMVKIARSVQVNEETVINVYTNHKKLNYETEKIDLYNEIVPESGNINELINDTNTIGNTNGSSPQPDANAK